MIEEDLSKQLGSSPRDREWDTEPDLEPYITSLENGGTQSGKGPLINCLSEIHHNLVKACCFLPMPATVGKNTDNISP